MKIRILATALIAFFSLEGFAQQHLRSGGAGNNLRTAQTATLDVSKDLLVGANSQYLNFQNGNYLGSTQFRYGPKDESWKKFPIVTLKLKEMVRGSDQILPAKTEIAFAGNKKFKVKKSVSFLDYISSGDPFYGTMMRKQTTAASDTIIKVKPDLFSEIYCLSGPNDECSIDDFKNALGDNVILSL